MLKVPQLDDLTYEQMINRAISKIPTMTDQWTDFNSHDPGITVLQTYAWLADMLNYYMDATGDVHVRKYLKLLGIEPQPSGASEGYVMIENAGEVLELSGGTRFYAGNIPFELEQDCRYSYNRFCSCIQETDGMAMDLTAFAGIDGDYAEPFSEMFSENTGVYLGFEKPLQNEDRLYISVKENLKRNDFGEDFSLGCLKWEYYTNTGWKALKVQDGTCGFLKSGFLQIFISEEMKPLLHPAGEQKAYYIRCMLEQNQYDCMPSLGMIWVNPIKVVQKYTVCSMGEMIPELKIGKTNGCAGQQLLFDYPEVYDFSLAIGDENDSDYEIWTMVDNLEQSGYKDAVFSYDRENRRVCFGDGICGKVPLPYLSVTVTGLQLSKLENGNVMAGEIRSAERMLPPESRIFNPAATTGGKSEETTEDMMRRLEDTLFVQNRMASEEDYEKIIMRTPGLMLEQVHVIPGKEYGEIYRQDRGFNEIMAVVKPYSEEIKPKLSEAYEERIRRYIEKYRLLNTKVSIVSPVYVGIEVNAKILLVQNTPEAREKVKEKIRELIDYKGKEKPFGRVISYGKIFTSLESMEEVKMVHELALEKNGSAALKNDRGDIYCQEDALCYVERLNAEFC